MLREHVGEAYLGVGRAGLELERLSVRGGGGGQIALLALDVSHAGGGFGVVRFSLNGKLVLFDGLGAKALVVGRVKGFGELKVDAGKIGVARESLAEIGNRAGKVVVARKLMRHRLMGLGGVRRGQA